MKQTSRNLIFCLLLVAAITTQSLAQVGIGTTAPNASSILELSSSNLLDRPYSISCELNSFTGTVMNRNIGNGYQYI